MQKESLTVTDLVFVLFLGLKLAGVINWYWWWVFAPLVLPVIVKYIVNTYKLYQAKRKWSRYEHGPDA
jgi:fatty-acid desaturase